MILLHNIGQKINSNYNTPEEIINCHEPLSFDGIYKNVYENRSVLAGKEVILFVTGKYVGGDNSFDAPMPLERFCTWEEINETAREIGAEIGWHTWSHPNLTTLKDFSDILAEVMPPYPMKHFAYPYGEFDERCIEAVKMAGFEDAWSVIQGNGDRFQRRRRYL